MTEEIAKLIIDYRDKKPFEKIEQVKNVEGMTDIVYSQISSGATVRTDWVKVSLLAEALNHKTSQHILSIIDRSEVPSKIVYWREN